MKIGFYIHHSNINTGGIYIYSKAILKLLITTEKIKSIVIFTTPEVKDLLGKLVLNPKIYFQIIDNNAFFYKTRLALSYFIYDFTVIYEIRLKKHNYLKWLKIFSVLINPYYFKLKRSGVSLFHVPIQYSPIYGIGIPVIITMHDLQEFHLPENFSSGERIHRAINNHKAIYDSDKIIVSFNHIKNDIVKYFKVEESKISVCPPPFADNWFTTNQETSWETLENKYSISKKYLLYPAATWQHKNHIRLLEAVKLVKDKISDIKLICTGNKTDYFSVIEKKFYELKLEDSVKFLGIVPEEDLIGLYKNTELVVIPTLYEAGSGPLYEAMRYEVPVICANTTSLPETIGDKRFIFDPEDEISLSKLIVEMISDENLSSENKTNSRKRMNELSKLDYFENFRIVYEKLAINKST